MNARSQEEYLGRDTIEALRLIGGESQVEARQQAIFLLGERTTSCRVLVELWRSYPWRETRIDIVRTLSHAISRCKDGSRGLEFLMRLAQSNEDLPMAREAILSLGLSGQMMAAEYLAGILEQSENPLKREVLVALSELNYLPARDESERIIASEASPQNLIQTAILYLGKSYFSKDSESKLLVLLDQHFNHQALFNTLLVTLGNIGSQLSLIKLKGLELRHRIFTDQLRLNAIEKIQMRQHLTIEDAFQTVKTDVATGLRMLAFFGNEEIRDSLAVLHEDLEFDTQLVIRVAALDSSHLDDDLKFIKDRLDSLSIDVLVRFFHGCHYHKLAKYQALLDPLPGSVRDEILLQIFVPEYAKVYLGQLTKGSLEQFYRQVNVIVAQAFMSGTRPKLQDDISSDLFKAINEVGDAERVGRLYRALGQIGYYPPHVIKRLSDGLKGGDHNESILTALGGMASTEANQVILKHLKRRADHVQARAEWALSIKALADSCCAIRGDILDKLAIDDLEISEVDRLKILSMSTIPSWRPLVLATLKSGSFQQRLLATAAVRWNHNEAIWAALFELLEEDDMSLSIRGLDSLCRAEDASIHSQFFAWLDQRWHQEWLVAKVIDCFEPVEGHCYDQAITILEKALAQRAGCLNKEAFQEQALALCDRLRSHQRIHNSRSGGANRRESDHDSDPDLGKELNGYHAYPVDVKSVLRNAELTRLNRDIFNDQVDKSTIIMEYTKAIDMVLQNRFGSFLLEQRILVKMQNQLIQMDLDQNSLSTRQLLSLLQCDRFFSEDSFPRHKFETLCAAIATGKIVYHQYRVLDGLRAWGLLLIIFGRKYSVGHHRITPLLPVGMDQNALVSRLVVDLNLLQESRNKAVHRGTVLVPDQMNQIRDIAIQTLNTLNLIFIGGNHAKSA